MITGDYGINEKDEMLGTKSGRAWTI